MGVEGPVCMYVVSLVVLFRPGHRGLAVHGPVWLCTGRQQTACHVGVFGSPLVLAYRPTGLKITLGRVGTKSYHSTLALSEPQAKAAILWDRWQRNPAITLFPSVADTGPDIIQPIFAW